MPNLFQLASQNMFWQAARQAAVAENVANANTPGYRARDVAPFEQVLEASGMQMPPPGGAAPAGGCLESGVSADADGSDGFHSGNTVSLEQEMLKAGQVRSGFALDAAVTKAFHGMVLSSIRG